MLPASSFFFLRRFRDFCLAFKLCFGRFFFSHRPFDSRFFVSFSFSDIRVTFNLGNPRFSLENPDSRFCLSASLIVKDTMTSPIFWPNRALATSWHGS